MSRFKVTLSLALSLFFLLLAFQNCAEMAATKYDGTNSSSQSPGIGDPVTDPNGPLTISALDTNLINNGVATVTFQLNKVDADGVAVVYQTINGTALAGTHFTAQSASVNIAAGQDRASVSIPILRAEAANIAFSVQISSVSKGQISKASATVTIPANAVAPVTNLNLRKMAAGYNFVCMVTDLGPVNCWGARPGVGGFDTAPVLKAGIDGSIDLAGGYYHMCALSVAGEVRCWGYNEFGQLGSGALGSRTATPTLVANLAAGVKQISAGNEYTCALSAQNTVFCWGRNLNGASVIPVQVANLTGVKQISAGGAHACAITAQDSVMCWGNNNFGQLGNGNRNNSSTPVAVPNLTGVKSILAGNAHTCAITAQDTAVCWGWNGAGQLGNNSTVDSVVPVAVRNLTGVKKLAAYSSHMCAINNLNQQFCWGDNSTGKLGINSRTDSLVPAQVMNLVNVIDMAMGDHFTCGRTAANGVSCWGLNDGGALGNNSALSLEALTPLRVLGL